MYMMKNHHRCLYLHLLFLLWNCLLNNLLWMGGCVHFGWITLWRSLAVKFDQWKCSWRGVSLFGIELRALGNQRRFRLCSKNKSDYHYQWFYLMIGCKLHHNWLEKSIAQCFESDLLFEIKLWHSKIFVQWHLQS